MRVQPERRGGALNKYQEDREVKKLRMKSKMTVAAVLLFSTIVLSLMTVGLQAKVDKEELTFTAWYLSSEPGYEWWSSDDIKHERGATGSHAYADGDWEWTLSFVANSNLNYKTGKGTGFGTWTWVVEASPYGPGTAEGCYTSKSEYNELLGDFLPVSAKGIGFGTGGFLDGRKIDCSSEYCGGLTFMWDYEILVLNPHP
jgi:hypothetical protein